MLSKAERRLLYWLARNYAAGDGAIGDAGCFLGGSTAALLAGVCDRAEPWTGPPVESYDLFRVEAFTITKIGWSGGPIDVLFLDLLKSWEINDAVLRDFFPSLVPGRSVIVHQDYGWGDTPWIPITVELMRDSLVLIDWMEWGTHVFFVESELPAELLERGVGGLDLDRKVELMEQAILHAEGWVQGMLEISRAMLLAEHEGPEKTLAELDAIRERHRHRGFVHSCIDDMRRAIERDVATTR